MGDGFEAAMALNAEVAERAYDEGWKAALASLADHDRGIKAEAWDEGANWAAETAEAVGYNDGGVAAYDIRHGVQSTNPYREEVQP